MVYLRLRGRSGGRYKHSSPSSILGLRSSTESLITYETLRKSTQVTHAQ